VVDEYEQDAEKFFLVERGQQWQSRYKRVVARRKKLFCSLSVFVHRQREWVVRKKPVEH
jgi:hypothetical protein